MKEKTTYTPLEPYKSVAHKCGHLLTAGSIGYQDVSDVPSKLCGRCQRRLQDAAPQLLEALEHARTTLDNIIEDSELLETYLPALLQDIQAAIQAAKETA